MIVSWLTDWMKYFLLNRAKPSSGPENYYVNSSIRLEDTRRRKRGGIIESRMKMDFEKGFVKSRRERMCPGMGKKGKKKRNI